MNYIGKALSFGLGFLLAGEIAGPPPAVAVPNFARKYDMSCNSCHTRIPRLNPFGQRFQENGYQIPGTEDGGITVKDMLGGSNNGASLDDVSNLLSVRLRSDVLQTDFRQQPTEVSEDVEIVFPSVINLFLAGSVTDNISVFMEGEYAPGEGHGEALGFERVMLIFSNLGGYQRANLKIGVFDPSSFYSFPTHRQQFNVVSAVADNESFPPVIQRAPVLPLAFSSKMFGLTRGPEGGSAGDEHAEARGPTRGLQNVTAASATSILPFEPFLFNSPYQTGVTLYGRPLGESFLYQVGLSQGATAEDDSSTRWDWYGMVRFDSSPSSYLSLQTSAFVYSAPKSARPALRVMAGHGDDGDDHDDGDDDHDDGDEHGGTLSGSLVSEDSQLVFAHDAIDWLRYGIGFRVQYRFLDLYGTAIWDRIDDPEFENGNAAQSTWDRTGMGVSLEGDWVLTDNWLLGLRYDFLDPGGLVRLPPEMQGNDPDLAQNVSFLGGIAKYYPRPNVGLYLRGHFNLSGSELLPSALGGSENPARNLRRVVSIGVDMAF